MKYCISDIHGDYRNFYRMLVKINFSASDHLYILGDVIDKGEENLCLLEFIRRENNISMIKGNHEYLCERYLKGIVSETLWDACGGVSTRKEVDRLGQDQKQDLQNYLESLPIWQLVTVKGQDYFLTHSGYHADFEVRKGDGKITDIAESVRSAVEVDQEAYLFSDDIHILPASVIFDRKVIVGHYPTLKISWKSCGKIYHGRQYTDIDAGNVLRKMGGRLACLRLEDGREFYI